MTISREKTSQALVEIMNEINETPRLMNLTNEIFGGVVLIGKRKSRDMVVKSIVTLMASGLSAEDTKEALISSSATNPEQIDQMVEGISRVVNARAEKMTEPDIDLDREVLASDYYARVIDGMSVTPEMKEAFWAGAKKTPSIKDEGEMFDIRGREAMLNVMRFMQAPHRFEISKGALTLADRMNAGIQDRVRDTFPDVGDADIETVSIDDEGNLSASVYDENGTLRTFSQKEDVPSPSA